MFYVVEVDNDGFKVYNSSGTLIDPATDGVLQAVRDRLGEVQAAPTQYTLLDRLREINLISGIKKIVDALPTGDNWIGRMKLGDGTNIVGQVLDGAAYRLLAAAKIARGATDLVNLDAIDTTTGQGRLKATLYTPDGDPVAFGAVSSSIKNDYVKNAGSSDLLVDGSTTPVVFEYLADSTYDISLQEIRFTMVSNGITFGNDYFGAVAGPLTNGVLVQVITDGDTVELFNLQKNEHFINFASAGGWEWIVSNKDVMTSAYLIGGGVKLHAGTGDQVKITVRDDIDAAGLYFECFVKGNLLTMI